MHKIIIANSLKPATTSDRDTVADTCLVVLHGVDGDGEGRHDDHGPADVVAHAPRPSHNYNDISDTSPKTSYQKSDLT